MIRNGSVERTRPTRVRAWSWPASRSSAVPPTGRIAAMPGNGVAEVMTRQEPITATAPVSAISSSVRGVSLRTADAGTSATSAPMPSSQARVKVEK